MTTKKWIIIACILSLMLLLFWPGLTLTPWHADEQQQVAAVSMTTPSNKPLSPLKTSKPNSSTPTQDAVKTSVVLSKRVTDYHIEVSLQENEHILQGEQIVTWTNPGRRTVSDMYIHMYANAFASNETTFMKESKGQLRGTQADLQSLGYIKLLSLETVEGENILPRVKFVSPDDHNEMDETVATFRLLEAVKPGESVTLRMKFEVKLPKVFARMGYSDDFHMAGQWYPKIAAYETADARSGRSEGWNIHQYHGNSEFYSNFGLYNVKINVPDNYTIAGTGMQTKITKAKDNRKIVQFYAEDVHDFAFAASPNFILHETSYSALGIPGVKIKLYLDHQHTDLSERYIHAAKSALAYLGKTYGSYPYSTLSIVVPPADASGAGGMEYPTLVTAMAAETSNPGYELERTVIHEIGHQYWYGMVASNEFEEAWLDEGFTSYVEEKIMNSVYGVSYNTRVESSFITNPAPLKQLSWEYDDHIHYAENVYMRAKLLLLDIEHIIGEKMMNKVLRTYFQKYKFNYPSTEQFLAVLEDQTKLNWETYFNKFVYGDEIADLKIAGINPRQLTEQEQTVYEYTILLEQNSGIARTIPIYLKYKDKDIIVKQWTIGQDAKAHFIERSSTPLEWIHIDPEQRNKLDHIQNNNFMFAETDITKRNSWSAVSTTFIDLLLRIFSW